MPTTYPRTPKLLKGALIELSERFLGPVPNVIAFQYNPEKVTRSLSPWYAPQPVEKGSAKEESSTAQPHDPPESFRLELELDATDALEEPESHPVAVLSGVADRIAALEMLLYPVEESLLSEALPSLFGDGKAIPRGSVPIVLFVWGPGRILPVRLTQFEVNEQAYSPTLYPVRATVTVGLEVLTPDNLRKGKKKLSTAEELAITAYEFTKKQKQGLAAANVAQSVDAVLGMLPF